jgi:class 3 adenylate cyclase
MAMLDEAMAAAVGGELTPLNTAIAYCNVISVCRDLADYRRAGDWTEVAKRWCERQSISGFPGLCRVFRAEIMRLRGQWADAEADARRAWAEVKEWAVDVAGEALYEIGEVRLRMGDLQGAEEAFREAHQCGRDPEPGMAMLRLREGKAEAALSLIRSALGDESHDRLARARLLPAACEIALAAGDDGTAGAAVDEMEEIARAYGTPALNAAAAMSRGALQVARAEGERAVVSLRRACKLWQEVDAPYEAARARVELARAYRAGGDADSATMELQAAQAAFSRLGAAWDSRLVTELLREDGAGFEVARRDTRTFMFTDIVTSTDLLEAIGDEAWEHLLTWHDQALRDTFRSHQGEELKHQGDGFFVAFPSAPAAVECAVAIQRRLVAHRREHGFSPAVRIGLHSAEATRRGRDYGGKGVHVAARIGACAGAGEILISAESMEDGPTPYGVSERRTLKLKGVSGSLEVASIDWR